MGSLNWDELDRAVRLLSLAQEHGLVLARNGDKLKMSQAVKHEDLSLDIIFRTLAANKVGVLGIMEDSAAVRQWLDRTQQQLINVHNELNDTMDHWVNVEKMYLALHPDSQGCLCAPSKCREDAVVRCTPCANGLPSFNSITGDLGWGEVTT
jgi:hypothetical protein